jgi:RND family efflux transporter MFP subunit
MTGKNSSRCLVVLLGAALLASGLPSCNKKDEVGKEALPVKIAKVGNGAVSKWLSYSGDIEGQSEIRVFSPIPDRIVALPAKEGDAVKAGDVLAVIRSASLSEGVNQAAAGLDAVRAQLTSLRDQQARLKKLEGSGAVTSSQVLAVDSQVASAEAQSRQFLAMLGQARQLRGDAVVRAPISGVIGQLFLEIGDMAPPQLPVASVVDMDVVKVKVRVPEPDLPFLKAGQRVEMVVAATGGTPREGVVSRVSPVLDRLSRSATMEIDFANPDHTLRPGMLARVRVEVERLEGVLVAPKDAFTVSQDRKGDAQLYRAVVLEGTTARERKVLLGAEEGAAVQILEGLEAGDTVVVRGQHLLVDGDQARVAGEDGAKP